MFPGQSWPVTRNRVPINRRTKIATRSTEVRRCGADGRHKPLYVEQTTAAAVTDQQVVLDVVLIGFSEFAQYVTLERFLTDVV